MTTIILIADHDRGLVQALDRCLRAQGFDVAIAHDALQCLFELQDKCPDVLILDPCVLWGGGAGILQYLIDEEPLKRPTVIYMEGQGIPPLPEYLQGRIDERIQRPHCLTELIPCVDSLMRLIRSHAAPANIAEPGEKASAAAGVNLAAERQYLDT